MIKIDKNEQNIIEMIKEEKTFLENYRNTLESSQDAIELQNIQDRLDVINFIEDQITDEEMWVDDFPKQSDTYASSLEKFKGLLNEN